MARPPRLRMALRTPTGFLACLVLAVLAALAIVAPILWAGKAGRIDVAHMLEGASRRHPLGTDDLGRDILARVLVAARPSLLFALLATLVGAAIGIPFGALPTVLGRRGARLANSLIDFSVAFPALLLAIFTAVVLGVGVLSAVLAIGVAAAPSYARLTQTLAASVAGSDYVAAARVVGVPRWRLLTRHILPNVAEPIVLNTTIAVGYALVAVSGLSFLGLGVQPPAYDWGQLLDDGLSRIYVSPSAALGPAVAIIVAGLAFNGLGEALAKAASTRPSRVPAGAAAHRQTPRHTDGAVPAPTDAVLSVAGLTVSFPAPTGTVTPVRGVSFEVRRGELLGIVGESGSGKSLTALAIAQLAPPSAEVQAKRLEFLGRDLRDGSAPERRRWLGTSLAMVFQDPATSLNPALRVGRQLAEVAEVHSRVRRVEAIRLAVHRLRGVRIASPERRIHQYPHELSGGMRQRAMIAMGLMGETNLIVADEPTSALDVTVQQQVLRLLRRVSADTGGSAIFITHDMGVVSELCHRVLVMYAGMIVEDLDITTLLAGPAHPYTRALLASVPDMGTERSRPLATIPGAPPEPHEIAAGCAFAPRCAMATERCRAENPPLDELRTGWRVACWHPQAGRPPEADCRLEAGCPPAGTAEAIGTGR